MEETRRTVDMKLRLSGTADVNLLYSLGGAEKNWIGWHDLNPDVKAKLVKQIPAQTKSSREQGGTTAVVEETRRTVDMKLCLSGSVDANLLYSLGDTEKHWIGCHDLKKTKLVKQILAQAKSARDIGAAVSTASRTAGATSRFTVMYSRLRTLKGETKSLSDDKTLPKLGILGQRDFQDSNEGFKASAGYQKGTRTRDTLEKAEHKRKQLDTTMVFIEEHTLPSEKKRNVLGTEGEVERLLTVL